MPRCLIVACVLGFASAASAQSTLKTIDHAGPVQALAWSKDGKLLVSAGDDGIRVTEVQTGKERAASKDGGAMIGVAISSDGAWIAGKVAGAGGAIRLFDASLKATNKTLAFQGYNAAHIAFTEDNEKVVAAGPGENMIWQFAKGGGSGSRSGNIQGSVSAVAPNGAFTGWINATGSMQTHDVSTRRTTVRNVGKATALAFSGDGKRMALAGEDKVIRLRDVGGDVDLRKFEGMRDAVARMAFSANGKVLAASADEDPAIRIWDAETGRLRRRVTAGLQCRAVAPSPDGLSVAVACGNRVQIWSVATRELGPLGKAKPLAPAELAAAWADLGSDDPGKAEGAFRQLAEAQSHAVGFFRERVRNVAVPTLDWKRIDAQLADLSNPAFLVRERAMTELASVGEFLRPVLEKHLKSNPGLEAERRAGALIRRFPDQSLTPDRLRCLEAIELLEILASPESRTLLEEIARDSLVHHVALAAREAAQRLARK